MKLLVEVMFFQGETVKQQWAVSDSGGCREEKKMLQVEGGLFLRGWFTKAL